MDELPFLTGTDTGRAATVVEGQLRLLGLDIELTDVSDLVFTYHIRHQVSLPAGNMLLLDGAATGLHVEQVVYQPVPGTGGPEDELIHRFRFDFDPQQHGQLQGIQLCEVHQFETGHKVDILVWFLLPLFGNIQFILVFGALAATGQIRKGDVGTAPFDVGFFACHPFLELPYPAGFFEIRLGLILEMLTYGLVGQFTGYV